MLASVAATSHYQTHAVRFPDVGRTTGIVAESLAEAADRLDQGMIFVSSPAPKPIEQFLLPNHSSGALEKALQHLDSLVG